MAITVIIAHIVVTPGSEVDLALALNNSHIEQVKSSPYLVISIDYNLICNDQITSICKKKSIFWRPENEAVVRSENIFTELANTMQYVGRMCYITLFSPSSHSKRFTMTSLRFAEYGSRNIQSFMQLLIAQIGVRQSIF